MHKFPADRWGEEVRALKATIQSYPPPYQGDVPPLMIDFDAGSAFRVPAELVPGLLLRKRREGKGREGKGKGKEGEGTGEGKGKGVGKNLAKANLLFLSSGEGKGRADWVQGVQAHACVGRVGRQDRVGGLRLGGGRFTSSLMSQRDVETHHTKGVCSVSNSKAAAQLRIFFSTKITGSNQ